MKMNLPNKLTVLRLCLVPVFLVFGMIADIWLHPLLTSLICAVLFICTAITDMLDGKIARKNNLVTDFGKFLDPVADKFMVIGAMFVILYRFEHLRTAMIIALIIVVFRELAVTSMRLVVSTGQNIVVAANMLGKVKTVLQIVSISTVFLEPCVQFAAGKIISKELVAATSNEYLNVFLQSPLTWITLVASLVLTLWSGIAYIKAYWKYLDPEK